MRIAGALCVFYKHADLTHEQLLVLRAVVKDSGSGVQGHTRSPVENARALLHVHQHRQRGASFDAAIKATATAELASPSTLRTAVQQFTATGAAQSAFDSAPWQRQPDASAP
jgi:hypothetical protein